MVSVKANFSNIDSWLNIHRSIFSETEINQFANAIKLAESYYQGSKFFPTDVDLLTHALTCASTVANLNLFSDAVLATILFAIPKFSSKWKEELSAFDTKVIELVDGINKVTQIRRLGTLADVENEEEKRVQVEVMRKMLLAMASDIRVVLIVC